MNLIFQLRSIFKKKPAKNFVALSLLKALSIPLVLSSTIVLARILGVDAFGRYSFLMALVPILTLPLSGGMSQFLTKEISYYLQIESWEKYRGIIKFCLTWVFLSFCALITLYYFIGSKLTNNDSQFALVLAIVFLTALSAVWEGALRGVKAPFHSMVSEQLVKPLILIIVVEIGLVCFGEVSIKAALWAHVTSSCAALWLVFFLWRRRESKYAPKGNKSSDNRQWIGAFLPFLLISFVYTLGANAGVVLLGILSNDSEVAAFRVAERGAQLVSLPLLLVNMVVAPYFSDSWNGQNMTHLRRLYVSSARVAFALSLPVALIFIFFGDWVVSIAFGKEYGNTSYVPLIILTLGQLVNVFFGAVGLLLSMTGHERLTLTGQTVGLVVNVTMCAILVPHYGAVGAACAVSFGMIVWNILLAFVVFKKAGVKPGVI